MSKQVNFYFLSAEYDIIDNYLNTFECAIISTRNTEKAPKVYSSLNEAFKDDWLIGIILLSDIEQINYIEKGNNIFDIDRLTSPIIELKKTIYNEESNSLNRGRIYFQTTYYNGTDDIKQSNNPETIELGDKIIKFIKKTFTKLDGNFKGFYSSTQIINSDIVLNLN